MEVPEVTHFLQRARGVSRALAKAALRMEALQQHLLARHAVDNFLTYTDVGPEEVREKFEPGHMRNYKEIIKSHDELAFGIIPQLEATTQGASLQPQINTRGPLINLLVVNLGPAAKSSFLTLWSLLRYRTVPLRVFVLGDLIGLKDWRLAVDELVSVGNATADKFRDVSFDYLDFESHPAFVNFMSRYPTGCNVDAVGRALLARLICHELLPRDVNRVIALDVGDVIVLDDVKTLWDEFDNFKEHHFFAARHVAALHHVNGGLVLYNLDRMRSSDWTSKALKAAEDGLERSGDCIHDQSILTTLHLHRPKEELSPMYKLPCKWMLVPALDWHMNWNTPEQSLQEIQASHRYPGIVSKNQFEVYCPDALDLLSGWSFLLLSGEDAKLRLRHVAIVRTETRLTECTNEAIEFGPVISRSALSESDCCKCREKASLVHIPGDMKGWPFVATLLSSYMPPWKDPKDGELRLNESLTKSLWLREERFASSSAHLHKGADAMAEFTGQEVCFDRGRRGDKHQCCTLQTHRLPGISDAQTSFRTVNIPSAKVPFVLEVETTVPSDAHLLIGQGPYLAVEVMMGLTGGSWSGVRWRESGDITPLHGVERAPQRETMDPKSGKSTFTVTMKEDGLLMFNHVSEWGLYLQENHIRVLREGPVGFYVGTAPDVSGTWTVCLRSGNMNEQKKT
eukprot:TRINITY_DN10875_c0_g2_i1.p1 TRINITY_DN10875_c0_g2~~TRINITY_DN10875_c0_g2_i1.p1  ORF type:complete len:682 (+),score=74.19 TRINITY_DN10875_c0_g2_i1:276-2321(+)